MWHSVSAGEVGGAPTWPRCRALLPGECPAGDGRGAFAATLLFSLLWHPCRNHPLALLAATGTGQFPPRVVFWPVLTQARQELRKIPAPHLEAWGPFLWAAAHTALKQISTALRSSFYGRGTPGSKSKSEDVIVCSVLKHCKINGRMVLEDVDLSRSQEKLQLSCNWNCRSPSVTPGNSSHSSFPEEEPTLHLMGH